MAIDSANALTTLIEAKAWLAVKLAPDTTYDTVIEKLIDSVSWQFNSFTNRLLKGRTITGYYEGNGSNTFMAPEYPINSITSINIDSDREYGTDSLIDSDTYTFDSQGFIVLDSNTFSTSRQANKIVYDVGYTTIPYNLNVAALDQIKFLFRRHLNNQEGISTESTINGSVTVTEVGEMLTSSLEILKRYRRRDHV